MRRQSLMLLILALAVCDGCGVSGSTQAPSIANSPIRADEYLGDVTGSPGISLIVNASGSATLTYNTVPPQVHTMTLPTSLVSKLYDDVASAMPLSALPQASAAAAFAGTFVISEAGQTSPNILGDTGIASTLATDIANIENQFPSRSP